MAFNGQTLLVISTPMGVPLYSARNLTQTITPIKASQQLFRTINGELDDLSIPEMRKYQIKITCTDFHSPALDGIWPGQQLTIDSCAVLAYAVGGTPQRTPVPLAPTHTWDGFVYYYPRLIVRVTDFSHGFEEWPGQYQWELDAEEL